MTSEYDTYTCPECGTPDADIADAWEEGGVEKQTLVCTNCHLEWEIENA